MCGTQTGPAEQSEASLRLCYLSVQPFMAAVLWQWEDGRSGKWTVFPFPLLVLILCIPLPTSGSGWDKVLLTRGQLMAGRESDNLLFLPHKKA